MMLKDAIDTIASKALREAIFDKVANLNATTKALNNSIHTLNSMIDNHRKVIAKLCDKILHNSKSSQAFARMIEMNLYRINHHKHAIAVAKQQLRDVNTKRYALLKPYLRRAEVDAMDAYHDMLAYFFS